MSDSLPKSLYASGILLLATGFRTAVPPTADPPPVDDKKHDDWTVLHTLRSETTWTRGMVPRVEREKSVSERSSLPFFSVFSWCLNQTLLSTALLLTWYDLRRISRCVVVRLFSGSCCTVSSVEEEYSCNEWAVEAQTLIRLLSSFLSLTLTPLLLLSFASSLLPPSLFHTLFLISSYAFCLPQS